MFFSDPRNSRKFSTSKIQVIIILYGISESLAVINDEYQARECLNITDESINPPSPVILEATVEDDFICENKPLLYSFSCTLYGNNLIWYFNNEAVAGFLPQDTVGDAFRVYVYESGPDKLYNITAILTQVSTASESRYNAPFCVSVLTVQPFNESQIKILPFTVACQTHCEGCNGTNICQTKHYEVAGMYHVYRLHNNNYYY